MLKYFKRETITAQLISGAEGTYIDGEWNAVLVPPVPIRIIAPQPVTANDTQFLEDGEHVRDYLVSWSKTKVYPREGGEDADRILFNSDTYKVVQADNRSVLGKFYRFVMRRLEPGTT
jgi:hypothetical protein